MEIYILGSVGDLKSNSKWGNILKTNLTNIQPNLVRTSVSNPPRHANLNPVTKFVSPFYVFGIIIKLI